MQSIAQNAAIAATNLNSANSPAPTEAGGSLLNKRKDAQGAATEAQFGDVLNNIQAKYGAKADKPREIKKTLGKDDFLRIMITQMRHQDPTNPFKAEQMAAEMAQFTSVEQLQNLNQNVQKMASQNQPLERLAMTNLIGKSVTIDRDRFAHVEGQNESLSYNLPKAASNVHLVVISEQGEVILDKEMGPQKQGENTFAWNGLKSNTLPAKSGNYILRMEAKDENGMAIQSDPLRKVRVVGVSFEGGEGVLLVGDNKRQDKIALKSVVRIEDGQAAAPGAVSGSVTPGSASQSIPAQGGPNFISFQKGVGSGNLDAAMASPEIAQALAKYEGQSGAQSAQRAPAAQAEASGQPASPQAQQSAAQQPGALPAAPAERGFPNGLQDQAE